MQHPTTQPEQAQTDHYLVFQEQAGGLLLVKQVEVPRYSQPNADGVRLDEDKQLSLAVARAVESKEGYMLHEAEVGEEFYVLDEVGDDEFEFVRYEQNPSFDAVWDPSETSEGEA